MTPILYLASQSPRRRELLSQIGVNHQVVTVDVDESRQPAETATAYVERLAREKAAAGWLLSVRGWLGLPVLGADTAVIVDDAILGKPKDEQDAYAILRRLSGRSHEVLTGVSVCGATRQLSCVSRTSVWFRALTDTEIQHYWDSGEPCDKAGAYGIQGLAARFIARIEGSYSGVVGLPLFETAEMLSEYGLVW